MTKMDPVQIQRAAFDEQQSAHRVVFPQVEMGIELNHEDGDSVYSHKKMQVLDCKAGDIIDTSLVETICVTALIELKAIILNEEFSMGTLMPMVSKNICVPAIKVSADCKVILRG